MPNVELLQTKQQLTYAAAVIGVSAAVAKSREIGAPECIAIVDAAGQLLAYARVEGAATLAREPAIAKAATAAALGMASGGIPSSSASISASPAGMPSSILGAACRSSMRDMSLAPSASARVRPNRTSPWPKPGATPCSRRWRVNRRSRPDARDMAMMLSRRAAMLVGAGVDRSAEPRLPPGVT